MSCRIPPQRIRRCIGELHRVNESIGRVLDECNIIGDRIHVYRDGYRATAAHEHLNWRVTKVVWIAPAAVPHIHCISYEAFACGPAKCQSDACPAGLGKIGYRDCANKREAVITSVIRKHSAGIPLINCRPHAAWGSSDTAVTYNSMMNDGHVRTPGRRLSC